jgi:hypothetical protein
MSVAEAVQAKTFDELNLDEKLDRLAEVAVKVGLGLKEGQERGISMLRMRALTMLRRGCRMPSRTGSAAERHGWRLQARIRRCWPGRTRPRWPAPTLRPRRRARRRWS